MKYLLIIPILILGITNASIAQTKIVCSEDGGSGEYSQHLFRTCVMGNYKSIRTASIDENYGGQPYFSYELLKKVNSKYIPIKNSELFNEKKVDLLAIINQRIKKVFDEYLKDPKNKDCLEGLVSANVSFEGLGIAFDDSEIEFHISLELSDVCRAIDGIDVSFKLDEITPYLNK